APVGGHRRASGAAESGGGGGAAVAGKSAHAGAGESGDRPAGRHAPDPIALELGDQDAPVRGHRHALGAVESGGGGGAAVAGEAVNAGAGDGGDNPAGRHAPDQIVFGVGDEEAPVGGHRDRIGGVESGGGGGAAVAGETLNAG